ncbi:Holliday junction resolvase RuvX [Thioalkalicoccus limnaeus]|uniref:Putative pre-16S rRNA nuclease n=1 Tax=Thioalkalicoccus limnaeus TaxID=120681 RepID=A0ABV4BD86_9GAMM
MATLLGFDYGPRKIGVAVGQTITGSASPLTTLRSREQRPDWDAIADLIGAWRPTALVVGLPFNMDDTEAVWADAARRFARQLQGRFGLAVHLVDERLTSLEARRQLGGMAKASETVDAMAAKLILETWLCDQQ